MLNTISFSMFCTLCTFCIFFYFSIEILRNSGLQNGPSKNLLCCHWNVNSLVAQKLSKIAQLEAYNPFISMILYSYLKHTLIHQF